MRQGSNTSNQYNCDNHITESAFEKLEKNNTQIQNVQEMVKAGYHSQVYSANRKAHLKKLADELHRKLYTLQNVLDIKFATYNFDASVVFLKDFPMVLALALKLKDDSTDKTKETCNDETIVHEDEGWEEYHQFDRSSECLGDYISIPEMGSVGESERIRAEKCSCETTTEDALFE